MEFLAWSLAHWWIVVPVYGVAFTCYAVAVGRSYIRAERTRANLKRPLYSSADGNADADADADGDAGTDADADSDGDGTTIVTAQRAIDSGVLGGPMERLGGVPRDYRHAVSGGPVRSDSASVA